MPRGKKVVKWFRPGVPSGWKKNMSLKERRELVLEAHNGDYLAAARSKQALANVTRDPMTKREALKDAEYFFRMHRLEG